MMVAGWERGRGAEEIHTSAWGWAILRARVVTEREGTCCGRGRAGSRGRGGGAAEASVGAPGRGGWAADATRRTAEDLHNARLDERGRHAVAKVLVHALLEVLLVVVEDQVQFGRCCDDVPQSDDVVVDELFQQRHLAQRGHRHPLAVVIEPELLERDPLSGGVASLVHLAVSALADLLRLGELGEARVPRGGGAAHHRDAPLRHTLAPSARGNLTVGILL